MFAFHLVEHPEIGEVAAFSGSGGQSITPESERDHEYRLITNDSVFSDKHVRRFDQQAG
jgi:hypothetical protein